MCRLQGTQKPVKQTLVLHSLVLCEYKGECNTLVDTCLSFTPMKRYLGEATALLIAPAHAQREIFERLKDAGEVGLVAELASPSAALRSGSGAEGDVEEGFPQALIDGVSAALSALGKARGGTWRDEDVRNLARMLLEAAYVAMRAPERQSLATRLGWMVGRAVGGNDAKAFNITQRLVGAEVARDGDLEVAILTAPPEAVDAMVVADRAGHFFRGALAFQRDRENLPGRVDVDRPVHSKVAGTRNKGGGEAVMSLVHIASHQTPVGMLSRKRSKDISMLAFGAGPAASAAHQCLTRAVARALGHAPAARLPLATATYAGAGAPRCRAKLVDACLEAQNDKRAPGATAGTVPVATEELKCRFGEAVDEAVPLLDALAALAAGGDWTRCAPS